VAAAGNGKIYAIGGESGAAALATVEEYDPATDTWATRTSMPTRRIWLGVAAASNGKIYAIGGRESNVWGAPVATVAEYDPTTDTWTTRTSMPTARDGLGSATASNGRIYAISDNTVEEYDPATDTWATRASMPTARRGLGVVAASNGKIYALGGFGGGYDSLTTVEEYDPATDTWATRPSMPTARSSLGVAVASNGRIYAIGGYDSSGPLATVEESQFLNEPSAFYGNQWLSPSRYRTFYDFSTLVSRGAYSLTVQSAVGIDGVEVAPNSAFTFTVNYAGAVGDTTPPPVPQVEACAGTSVDSLSASWHALDPDSAITLYRYAIGTTPGRADVVNWANTPDTSFLRTGLSLITGQPYYVGVKARNEGGLWSEAGISGVVAGSGECTTNVRRVYLPLVLRRY